jgi:hypothetical protein
MQQLLIFYDVFLFYYYISFMEILNFFFVYVFDFDIQYLYYYFYYDVYYVMLFCLNF